MQFILWIFNIISNWPIIYQRPHKHNSEAFCLFRESRTAHLPFTNTEQSDSHDPPRYRFPSILQEIRTMLNNFVKHYFGFSLFTCLLQEKPWRRGEHWKVFVLETGCRSRMFSVQLRENIAWAQGSLHDLERDRKVSEFLVSWLSRNMQSSRKERSSSFFSGCSLKFVLLRVFLLTR